MCKQLMFQKNKNLKYLLIVGLLIKTPKNNAKIIKAWKNKKKDKKVKLGKKCS